MPRWQVPSPPGWRPPSHTEWGRWRGSRGGSRCSASALDLLPVSFPDEPMCDKSPRSPSQYRSPAANSSHLAFSSAKLREAATPLHMRSLNSASLMDERAMPTMLNVRGQAPLEPEIEQGWKQLPRRQVAGSAHDDYARRLAGHGPRLTRPRSPSTDPSWTQYRRAKFVVGIGELAVARP